MKTNNTKIVLTIAGSDSSSGAGIQADIKTFAALNAYGLSVITALTAQNSEKVLSVLPIPADFILKQLEALFADFSISAIKIGMLGKAEVVETLVHFFQQQSINCPIVLDPVLKSTSGTSLLEQPGIEMLKKKLIPQCKLITPNIPELGYLLDKEISPSENGMQEAASEFYRIYKVPVLIKGGHRKGEALDIFYDGEQFERYSQQRIENKGFHGTGCVFSSAITAFLSHNGDLKLAIKEAKAFITHSLMQAKKLGKGDYTII